jgi:hypothetical protein
MKHIKMQDVLEIGFFCNYRTAEEEMNLDQSNVN